MAQRQHRHDRELAGDSGRADGPKAGAIMTVSL
jgi:hypothetical protein